jgi:uroporphyrinogen-III synthase
MPSYVMSEQTAKLAKDFNAKIAFIGKTKHGNEFAYELIDQLRGKKVLYLRGKDVVSDLIGILHKEGIMCDDEVVYENRFNDKVKKKKLPKNSKIIFTSPSTIKYFFKIYRWDDSYTAISIGRTTADNFPKNIKPIISEDTSFQACVNRALSL